ncbi:hypothetical protein LG299_11810 [Microbacterium lacus]|uniref:hypothetical protein n=1 Tax=Microbacterium lacus TaxID=415217 RepID=UPI00384D5BF6
MTSPRIVLAAASVVAILSVAGTLLDAGWVLLGALSIAAGAIIFVAARSAMLTGSRVLAPLAVCVVAVGNPLAVSAVQSFIAVEFDTIARSTGGGLVDWALYPGVADLTPTTDQLQTVDTAALATAANASLRSAVETLAGELGHAWTTAECTTGVLGIPNGFGGGSEFVRVQSAVWVTESFDGSDAQREVLLRTLDSAAAQLALTEIRDTAGDVRTGDGMREWRLESQSLSLTIARSTVSMSFIAGPLLSSWTTAAEFEDVVAPYSGVQPPAVVEETHVTADGEILPICGEE